MEPWTVTGLRVRCERMRTAVQLRKLASEDEVARWWPGGAENPTRDRGAWIVAYGRLAVYLARGDRDTSADRERTALAALRSEPKVVDLVTPLDERTRVTVHAKGHDALRTLAQMERVQRELVLWRTQLEEEPEPGPDTTKALDGIARALTRTCATFVWTVTHPGPGVPWSDRFVMPWDQDDLPPSWCWDVDPYDLVRLAGAHTEVNYGRLQTLPRTEEGKEGGLGWATFFANVADATRESVGVLMADRPFASLLAQSALVADSHARAKADAAAKAKAG